MRIFLPNSQSRFCVPFSVFIRVEQQAQVSGSPSSPCTLPFPGVFPLTSCRTESLSVVQNAAAKLGAGLAQRRESSFFESLGLLRSLAGQNKRSRFSGPTDRRGLSLQTSPLQTFRRFPPDFYSSSFTLFKAVKRSHVTPG